MPALKVRDATSKRAASAAENHEPRPTTWLPGKNLVWALSFALAAAVVASQLVPRDFELLTKVIISWDAALVVMLPAQWLLILNSSPRQIERRAQADDPGNFLLLFVAIGASVAGLAGAVFLLDDPDPAMAASMGWGVPVIVLTAIVGGWLMIQTAYALHYARLYYAREDDPGGLTFAGDPPDDVDFAYFAFSIGMTFQVSDVQVTTRRMRQVVLVQALISFVYNLVVFALMINIVAGRI